jgi:NAD(P)H-flavin reductase
VLVAGAALLLALALVAVFLLRKPKPFLDKTRKRVQITDVVELSPDTKRIRLSLGSKGTVLGLPTGKHIVCYAPNPQSCLDSQKWNEKPDADRGQKTIERKYTPVTGNETTGYVDLVVKIYRPGSVKMPDGKEANWADGGKFGLFLDTKKPGDYLEIMGPVGLHEYLGRGTFKFPGQTKTVSEVGMMAGGTGLTPMMQVVQAALRDSGDTCKFTLLYANKREDDILCKDMLDELEKSSQGRFKVHYTLDFPPAGWTGKTGFITQEMIKECLPPVSAGPLMLMCGPPPMVQFACKQNLEAMGYDKKSFIAF